MNEGLVEEYNRIIGPSPPSHFMVLWFYGRIVVMDKLVLLLGLAHRIVGLL